MGDDRNTAPAGGAPATAVVAPSALAHLDPPATYEEARHFAATRRPEDCRIEGCRVHGGAAPTKPRELTPAEKRQLAEAGTISIGKGYVIEVNRGPFSPWLASTCSLCDKAAPPPHAHRINTSCIYCGAAKVWPRNHRVGELFCFGCGRWWDPGDQLAKSRPSPFEPPPPPPVDGVR